MICLYTVGVMADPPGPVGRRPDVAADAAPPSTYAAAQVLSSDTEMNLAEDNNVGNDAGGNTAFLCCVFFTVNGLVPSVSNSLAV